MANKIDKLVINIGNKLQEKKLTLVTAESCTGGGIAYFISINPEASPILERAYVTYSNHAKQELLDVPTGILQMEGAVSRSVALAMAKGALQHSEAQLALAVTGIAGADIQQKRQQKGLIWIACCSSVLPIVSVKKKYIAGKREQFCQQAILACLKELILYIKKLS